MSTAKSKKSKHPKIPETITTRPDAPAEDQAEQIASKVATSDHARRVLSVNFPARTVRQLKLLASVEGVSIASIVVSSVTRTVNKRLPAALAEIAKSGDVGG